MSTALAIREEEETAFSEEILSAFAEIRDNYQGAKIDEFLTFARQNPGPALDVVSSYFEVLNRSGFAASTIRTKRQAVKARLRRFAEVLAGDERAVFEHRLRMLDADPETKCPGAASPALAPYKVVQPDEYAALIRGARSDRQRRFLEFLYNSGCRVSEMTGVKLVDCRIEGGSVRIKVRGKGDRRHVYKERTVEVSERMFSRIRATFRGETFLFETGEGQRYSRSYVSNQIGRLTLAVLGRRLGAHCLRHTYISRMLRKQPPEAVSRYVGHSDVSITLRVYAHNTLSTADVLGAEVLID